MRDVSVSPSALRRLRKRRQLDDAGDDLRLALGGPDAEHHARRVLPIGPFGRDVELGDLLILAIDQQHALAARDAVLVGDLQEHEAVAIGEIGDEQPVVENRLPVARPPGMIAPAVTVDRPVLGADADLAAHAAMLVEMAEREVAAIHGRHAVVDRLAAMDRRLRLVGPADMTGQPRPRREQRLRLTQFLGIVDDDQLAVEGHRHFLQRLDHRVDDAAGVEAVVATRSAGAGTGRRCGRPADRGRPKARHSLR